VRIVSIFKTGEHITIYIFLVEQQGQTRLARYYEERTDVSGEERTVQEADIVRKCLMRGDQQVCV